MKPDPADANHQPESKVYCIAERVKLTSMRLQK